MVREMQDLQGRPRRPGFFFHLRYEATTVAKYAMEERHQVRAGVSVAFDARAQGRAGRSGRRGSAPGATTKSYSSCR